MLLTPEEFDAVQEYDDCYRYELMFGVLVVNDFVETPIASASQLLGFLLLDRYDSPSMQEGQVIASLPGRYIPTKQSRWRVDRVIWIGPGPLYELCKKVPAIAVDFVPEARRGRILDYDIRRREFASAGVKEYWVIDRFERRMHVHRLTKRSVASLSLGADKSYSTPLLPEFVLPISRLFRDMNRWKCKR